MAQVQINVSAEFGSSVEGGAIVFQQSDGPHKAVNI
jgi:hypothetical protein